MLSAPVLLRDESVLILDCQATGATPEHGDLLELGWAMCGARGLAHAARSRWIVPRTDRGVSRWVRKLTGWTDGCASEAVASQAAWQELRADALRVAQAGTVRTVIHFARFEMPFLRQLHDDERALAAGSVEPFPLTTVCLHAIATRIFPDLPRRNLRALAGHLGHSPELVRRSAGHVEATAFIWRALLPALEERGVTTWEELEAWLDREPAAPTSRARGQGRVYPFSVERRRALPDTPGVYRFLRPNGDVLYVGKAASLKKRVASHFAPNAHKVERALEMLSQAHDVSVTELPTALEAAVLEADEIKRLDPPYNVHLRTGDRRAWFASRDWQSMAHAPDGEHVVGPLPARDAVLGIAAVRAMLEAGGADAPAATDEQRAAAVGVPVMFGPPREVFDEAWRGFVSDQFATSERGSVRTRVLRAAGRMVVRDDDSEDDVAPVWDVARVRRYLERTVVQEGQLVRRAQAIALLCDARVAFREPRGKTSRVLLIAGGEVVERGDAASVRAAIEAPPQSAEKVPSKRARQNAFDAARYDRLRVLATELRRVKDQGGEVAIGIGKHVR